MTRIIETSMEKIQIIEKKDTMPIWDKKEVCLTELSYYPSYETYAKADITEAVVAKLMDEISSGIEAYLYLDEYAELEYLNVVSDGTWISLGYCNEDIWYSSFNDDFGETEEYTPLDVGGQSPVEKRYALLDIELGKKAVEYFIYTGKLYPCMDWATPLEENEGVE